MDFQAAHKGAPASPTTKKLEKRNSKRRNRGGRGGGKDGSEGREVAAPPGSFGAGKGTVAGFEFWKKLRGRVLRRASVSCPASLHKMVRNDRDKLAEDTLLSPLLLPIIM